MADSAAQVAGERGFGGGGGGEGGGGGRGEKEEEEVQCDMDRRSRPMTTRRPHVKAAILRDDVYPQALRECRTGPDSARSLGLMRHPVTTASTWRVPSLAAR